MYLKNLTVLGFKSFADKTSLNFQPGVTAIVGPNGCGKSNVSDAIRWVLGEQSAKALRGGEMADVIFNGTDGRKPLGMAEVSLTIGGVDGENIRAAGVEVAYDEVTVTRRVFRDGGSEYFINKVGCRLRDIQQLFMGTGVGRTSYSIMAQGNITQILSSRPEDRRMIFEEAAGITKFKAQKKESLRKLEYTEQNLLRIADLVREVKRQIGSLQRQAGKARRYKQLAQELEHLDTQLARHHLDVLHTEIREREEKVEQLRHDIEAGTSDVLRTEDEITHLRGRLAELERQVALTQQRGLELKGEIDRHESRVHFNQERLSELEAQNAKAFADMAQSEERLRTATEELAQVVEQLAASEIAVEERRQSLADRQEALRHVEEALRVRQEMLRQAQSALFGAAQDLSRSRNEITALDLQKQGNSVRLEKLSAEKLQLEEERGRLEIRINEFAASVEAEKVTAASQRGTVEERQQRLRQIQEELGEIGRDLDQALQQQAEKRSRLNVLEQLQTSHEGFSSGSLAALRQSQHVLGSLADRIRVPNQFVTAIETALGAHLQLVLTENPESAQEILTDLRNNKRGRASVAALAMQANRHGSPANAAQAATASGSSAAATAPEPQLTGTAFSQSQLSPSLADVELNGAPLPALDIMECEPSVRLLLQRLLGTTQVVRDLAAATSAWHETQGAHYYVTLAGETLSHHGVFTGGASGPNGNGKAPESILGRRNQIEELRGALSVLHTQVAEISRRKGAMQSEQTELQAGLQHAQTELRAQEVAIATHEGEYNALRNSHRLLHQKIDTVMFEVQSLAAQEQEGLQKRQALATRLAQCEDAERSQQDLVAEFTASLDELRAERDGATSTLTECKVAMATLEQVRAGQEQRQGSLEQRVRELGQFIEQRKVELGSFVIRKEQAESEIQQSLGEARRLQHEREQVNAQAADLISLKQTQDLEVSGREERLRDQRRLLAGMQEQRSSFEVELAQKNMGAQNLRERIQQKYHLNLDDVRSECITITFADEGPARVHTLSPAEMAASGAATDWSAVARQVEFLQQRLDEMGPVNLVAIEEYEETEQRYQFLSKQHDELVTAKAQLLDVINRINTQTRDMFRNTFEQIRDNFRVLFTEVFGGGKADLVLMNENDLLESGIEIVARPPGKQLQTISLLSGGEQTMTAVALLFSIYQVKPSPFCVLDELDAPLDESNVNRFIKVLQRFLAHSQFVIITHNKRTIGMADVLYGVTMQEHGVSRIVSVRLRTANENESEGNALSLESGRPLVSEKPGQPARDEASDVVMAK